MPQMGQPVRSGNFDAVDAFFDVDDEEFNDKASFAGADIDAALQSRTAKLKEQLEFE